MGSRTWLWFHIGHQTETFHILVSDFDAPYLTDKCVQMPAPGQLTIFPAQAPNGFFEMNPEIVRLLPHQREEHLDAHRVRQLVAPKRERGEQLPFDE